jgi:hypothetical protein
MVFDLLSVEHESSGEYVKRASLDVCFKRHWLPECVALEPECEKPWLGEKFRLGKLNQIAGQGWIDNSEGCGENFFHKGIILTQS